MWDDLGGRKVTVDGFWNSLPKRSIKRNLTPLPSIPSSLALACSFEIIMKTEIIYTSLRARKGSLREICALSFVLWCFTISRSTILYNVYAPPIISYCLVSMRTDASKGTTVLCACISRLSRCDRQNHESRHGWMKGGFNSPTVDKLNTHIKRDGGFKKRNQLLNFQRYLRRLNFHF